MGKGDKKTKRGKIILGSHGVTRPRKKGAKKVTTNIKPEVKEDVKPKAKPKAAKKVKEVKEE